MNDKRLEPMAYLCENAVGHKYFRWKKPPSTYKPIALYTLPSQRKWVGLTDQEITYIESMTLDTNDAIRMAAVALMEKNT